MKNNKHIQFVCQLGSLAITADNRETRWAHKVLCQNYSRVEVVEPFIKDDLQMIADSEPDFVFLGAGLTRLPSGNVLKSTDIWLSEFFESEQIAFSGSASAAMKLGVNKRDAKSVINKSGLKTAAYFTVPEGEYLSKDDLPLNFPLFIKPDGLGGGVDISDDSVVRDFASFQRTVQNISREHKTEIIAEEYLSGREFTVAILEDEQSGQLSAMPVELTTIPNANGDRIVSGSVKKADSESVLPVPDRHLNARLSEFALDSFRALDGRDYGRIDIRMDHLGVLNFIEANLRPGLGSGYFVRACWINRKLWYSEIITRITELGLARSKQPFLLDNFNHPLLAIP